MKMFFTTGNKEYRLDIDKEDYKYVEEALEYERD